MSLSRTNLERFEQDEESRYWQTVDAPMDVLATAGDDIALLHDEKIRLRNRLEKTGNSTTNHFK